jgi:hypothetical protein
MRRIAGRARAGGKVVGRLGDEPRGTGAACGDAGFRVAARVADCVAAAEVRPEHPGGALEQPGRGLATAAAGAGCVGAEEAPSDRDALFGEVLLEVPLEALVVFEREQAPADAALVGHDGEPEARVAESAQRADDAGQQLVVFEAVGVAAIADEGAVPIEEDEALRHERR